MILVIAQNFAFLGKLEAFEKNAHINKIEALFTYRTKLRVIKSEVSYENVCFRLNRIVIGSFCGKESFFEILNIDFSNGKIQAKETLNEFLYNFEFFHVLRLFRIILNKILVF